MNLTEPQGIIKKMSASCFKSRVARNEMEGGSTGIDIKYQTNLTEPQGITKKWRGERL